MGKDQHVCGSLHPIRGQHPFTQFRIEGGIDVHFALVTEIMFPLVEQFDRSAQTGAGAVALIAELTLGAEGNLGLDAEAAHMTRSPDGNLRNLIRIGVRVHMGVRDKERAVFKDHQ